MRQAESSRDGKTPVSETRSCSLFTTTKSLLLPNVECMQSLGVGSWSAAVVEVKGTVLNITSGSRGQHHVNHSTITPHRRQLSTDRRQVHLASHLLVVLQTAHTTLTLVTFVVVVYLDWIVVFKPTWTFLTVRVFTATHHVTPIWYAVCVQYTAVFFWYIQSCTCHNKNALAV